MRAPVLLCINQHTKFEVPSFNNSKDMIRDLIRDFDNAHYGAVCHPKASTGHILHAYKICNSLLSRTVDITAGIKTDKKLSCSWQTVTWLPVTKKWKATPNVKNSRFEPPFGGLRGNAHGSSMARRKACCRLPISDNWIFLASSHGCGTIKRNLSKSAFSDGGASLLAQILGRWGRCPQSIYGPLNRGTM